VTTPSRSPAFAGIDLSGNDCWAQSLARRHADFARPRPLDRPLARREITAILRQLLQRVPGIRAAAEPDRLLSSSINRIMHLPCEFTA
jgi:hypothetical protein